MAAIVYPAELPGPMPGGFEPRPRRRTSPLEGPLQQRAHQRDAAGMASQYAYIYTAEQMAVWRDWYRDTLLDGRRWFVHSLPGAGGMVSRVVRYRSVQQQLLGSGIYRVSAGFEQRGSSLQPQLQCEPNIIFQAGFNSSEAFDISVSMLGNGTRLGAGGTMSPGGFTYSGNSGDMLNHITQGLQWDSASLNPAIGQGRTYEMLLLMSAVVGTPSAYLNLFDLIIGPDNLVRVGINGGGPAGQLHLSRVWAGSAQTWATAPPSIYGRQSHLAIQLRPRVGNPSALDCDVYLDGELLCTNDWGPSLVGMTTTALKWFGGTQYVAPHVDITLMGARVSDITRYSANFTPPDSFLPPCAP